MPWERSSNIGANIFVLSGLLYYSEAQEASAHRQAKHGRLPSCQKRMLSRLLISCILNLFQTAGSRCFVSSDVSWSISAHQSRHHSCRVCGSLTIPPTKGFKAHMQYMITFGSINASHRRCRLIMPLHCSSRPVGGALASAGMRVKSHGAWSCEPYLSVICRVGSCIPQSLLSSTNSCCMHLPAHNED